MEYVIPSKHGKKLTPQSALNPTEELFSLWRWKFMTHCPHNKISILDAMNAEWVHKIVNDHAC